MLRLTKMDVWKTDWIVLGALLREVFPLPLTRVPLTIPQILTLSPLVFCRDFGAKQRLWGGEMVEEMGGGCRFLAGKGRILTVDGVWRTVGRWFSASGRCRNRARTAVKNRLVCGRNFFRLRTKCFWSAVGWGLKRCRDECERRFSSYVSGNE